jgi:FixJ family two-component response regulator
MREDPAAVTRARPVVVVDDNEGLREVLEIVLSTEGHPVVCFADGEEFLKNNSEFARLCLS